MNCMRTLTLKIPKTVELDNQKSIYFGLNCVFLFVLLMFSVLEIQAQDIDKNASIFVDYNTKQAHSLSDFEGKYILIDFWGLGCKPCVEAALKMVALQEKYKDKFIILAVNDSIFIDKLPSFIQEKQINYPVVHCKDYMKVYKSFSEGNFYGFPYYVLLDKKGDIMKRHTYLLEVVDFLAQQ